MIPLLMMFFPAEDGRQDLKQAGREIVVTARRIPEAVEDAPLSVAVITSEEIGVLGIQGLDDVIRRVPNAERAPRGPAGNAAISVRGIFSPAGAASVGIYVDDVPVQIRPIDFAGDPDLRLEDLERVELLRGPQGTLFGASSLGGTLRLVTASPESKPRYTGDVEVNHIDGGGWGGRLGGMATGPLAGEHLTYRVSGRLDREAGWVDRFDRVSRKVTASAINRRSHATLRGAVRAELGAFTVTPSLLIGRTSAQDLPIYQSDLGAFRQSFSVRQPGWDRFQLGTLTVSGPLAAGTFTSVTSVLGRSAEQISDYSSVFGELVLGGIFPGLEPDGGSRSHVGIKQRHLTHEFRLNSSSSGRLRWVAGAFFQRSRFDLLQQVTEPGIAQLTSDYLGASVEQVFGVPLLPGSVTYLGRERVVETQAALYGDASLVIAKGLEVFAGVRFSRSQVDLEVASAGPYAGVTDPIGTFGRQVETPVTPRAGVRYRISPAIMVYASAGRGFRAGGANTPVPLDRCRADLSAFGRSAAPAAYGADTVWSYELGAKVSARRVDLQAAVFRLDWSDTLQQISLPNCGFSYNENLGGVRSQGLELEASAQPVAGLKILLATGYVDARFRQTIASSPLQGPAALVVSRGDRTPYTPKGSARLATEYTHTLSGANGFLRGEVLLRSGFRRSPGPRSQSFVAETFKGPGYVLLNGDIGLQARRWRFALFVDNATNAHPAIYSSADLVPVTRQPLRRASIDPRTFGFRLGWGF